MLQPCSPGSISGISNLDGLLLLGATTAWTGGSGAAWERMGMSWGGWAGPGWMGHDSSSPGASGLQFADTTLSSFPGAEERKTTE